MPPVSIREVAARAGVSRATVSRVLNKGTADLVAEPTRSRVRQAAIELGYHPSAVARGLAGKPMNSIGVVLAYILPSVTSDPYLGPVLDGILDMDKRRHQKTVLFTANDWEEAYEALPMYRDGHCDGLLLVIPRIDSRLVLTLQQQGPPLVIVGDSRADLDLTMVDVDNVAIAHQAVAYLLEQGHRRIAALGGNWELTSSAQRLKGYRRALEEAGVPYDPALALPGEYWEWSGYENTVALLRLPRDQRPTALFCSNGRIAIGALRALKEQNIPVPQEVSVIALCESAGQAATDPPLTAVQMPLRQIGERAVEALLALIHEDAPAGEKILLPGDLVVRQSVAPPQ